MNRSRRILIFIALCSLAIAGSWTQRCAAQMPPPPQATFTTPAANATNISVSPTIQLRTNLKIVVSSVHSSGADAVHDPDPIQPTISVIPKLIADSLADSLELFGAVRGTVTRINDTTLTFTPAINLVKGVTYVAKISGLKVRRQNFTGGFDTLDAPVVSTTFTTVLPGFRLAASSVPAAMPRCNERPWVRYNRKLSGTSFPSGNLLVIERLDSIRRVNDSVATRYTTPISTTNAIDPADSTMAYAVPVSPLTPGGQYSLVIRGSFLTGDLADDRRISFQVPAHYRVTVKAKLTDTTDSIPSGYVLPKPGTTYQLFGDTVTIAALPEDSTFTFLHWRCTQDTTIDSNSEAVLRFARSCSQIGDLDITAVFIRRDSITVTVGDTTHARTVVYNSSFDSLGGAGTYRLAKNDHLYIAAVTADTLKFTAWKSSDLRVNDSPRSFISIGNHGRNVNILPQKPAPPGGGPVDLEDLTFAVCGTTRWEDPSRTDEIFDDIVTLRNATGQTNCDETGFESDEACLTAKIENDCYEVIGYQIQFPGQGVGDVIPVIPPSSEHTVCLPSTRPSTTIFFIIRPKSQYALTVHTVIQDNVDGEIGPDKDVTVVVNELIGSRTQWTWSTDGSPKTYMIDCDNAVEVIAMTTNRRAGYEFLNWETSSGWTAPSTATNRKFSFRMGAARQIKAYFEEKFVLRQIGFHQGDQFNAGSPDANVTWYPVEELDKFLAFGGGGPIQDIDITHRLTRGFGAFVYFKFNRPVNTTLAEGQLFARDESPRIDNALPRAYNLAGGADWSNGNRQVRLELAQIPKGEVFLLAVQLLKDATGRLIDNPGIWRAETEMPGVDVTIKKVTPLSQMGDWLYPDVEMYTPFTVTHTNGAGDTLVRLSGQVPTGQCFDQIPANTTVTYNELVFRNLKMGRKDRIGLGLVTKDNDNAAACSPLEPFRASQVDLITLIIIVFTLSQIGIGLAIAGEIVGVAEGAALLGGSVGVEIWHLLKVAPQLWHHFTHWFNGLGDGDDFMGDRTWMFGWDNSERFGSDPSVIPSLTATSKDVRYEVEFKLKTDDIP